MTSGEAARFGEVVVVSVPFGRYRELPSNGVAGKVVIDTNTEGLHTGDLRARLAG